jgi:hypothetical protein
MIGLAGRGHTTITRRPDKSLALPSSARVCECPVGYNVLRYRNPIFSLQILF